MRLKSILPAALAAVLLMGAGCSLIPAKTLTLPPVTLTYWRTEDDPAAFDSVIAAYRKVRPNVNIVYRKIPTNDFNRVLLEALAVDEGPDLFSVPVTDFGMWQAKIVAMPAKTTILTQTVNANKQLTVVKQESATMNLLDLRTRFVEGVAKDIVSVDYETGTNKERDAIWALPYSYDTLAMFTNKTLLKNGAVAEPPKSWREVQEVAGKLTIRGEDGSIRQSGAALGGGDNVKHAADIVATLMWQNGATIADDNGYARFHAAPRNEGSDVNASVEALQFYDGFLDAFSPSQSWSTALPYSLDSFVAGRTAIMFGYPADVADIKSRAPGLDLGVSPVPQINPGTPRNMARYPLEVVSKKSANVDIAWDFLQFASRQENISDWLAAVKRPTALRGLIATQLTDPNIAPFAGQILTGRSWYKGKDWSAVETAFNALIATRPTDQEPELDGAVSRAAAQVNASYR